MNNFSSDDIFLYLMGLGAIVLIFLALRSIVLWYYKIDKIVQNQTNIEIVLKDILNELQKSNKKDSRYFDTE